MSNGQRLHAALDAIRGKTITAAAWDWRDSERAFGVLTLEFDDGTNLRLASYDYEGYSSGIELWDELEEKERIEFEEVKTD